MILRTTERQGRGGFTLMEILVVVAILVILASVGGYYYMGSLENAKLDVARLQIKALENGCETYKLNSGGDWPSGLQALLQPVNGKDPSFTDPEKLLDPWKRPYQYNPQGSRNGGVKPDIWCVSPKGQEVGNWPTGR